MPDDIAELRRLIYCGEWISSHALHIYLLHAPDFLNYPTKTHLRLVNDALGRPALGRAIA